MKPTSGSRAMPSGLQFAGIVLALGGLIWVLQDVHPGTMLASIRAMDWRWLVPAIAFDVLSYYCQGLRWQLLLAPVGRISAFSATESIYVGLFTSEVLPLRIGELARAFLVSRRLDCEVKKVFPSIAVERLFDAFWMAAAIGITAVFIPLPRNLARAADVLGVLVLVATGLLLWVVLREAGHMVPEPNPSLVGRVTSFVFEMTRGLQEIGLTALFYRSLAISPLVLLFQAMAFWMVLIAYGIHLSLWAAVAVYLVIRLGTVIPNAPANVGSYQFFCVLGLTLFGVNKSVAAGFSFVVFAILTVPLWILGMISLSRTGMTLRAIQSQHEPGELD
jgi:glycosyltransferase 2 family protein